MYTYVYTQHPKKTSLQKTRQYIIWILIPRDTFVKRLLASVLIIRLFGCCCGWFLKVFQLIHQAESSQFSFKVYISGRCGMGRLVPLELKALTGGGKKNKWQCFHFCLLRMHKCCMPLVFCLFSLKRGNHLHKPISEYCEKGRLWSLL